MLRSITLCKKTFLALFVVVLVTIGFSGKSAASNHIADQQGSGSIGLEGRISTSAPTKGATITTPVNGASFTTLPVTVNGLCPKGLLVKLFTNNVFVGSVNCTNGNYSIQIDLFSGQNQIVARVYDSLDQPGPDSNTVNVNFEDPQFTSIADRLFLTSIFARRGAMPNTELIWPIILTGGTGPYAISVDWGDNTPPDLRSESFAGNLDIKHTYKTAGIYKVIVRATDSKGNVALLQLSAVATGAVIKNADDASGNSVQITKTDVLWWPILLMVPLIIFGFWLGKRSELYTIRRKLEKARF